MESQVAAACQRFELTVDYWKGKHVVAARLRKYYNERILIG